MNQFTNYVELQAEKAENLSFCRGIKLLHIRDKVETMLGFIGKGGIFEEYTVHSIEHIDEMLKIVEWLIPDITKEKMTYAEWLMLTLAIYFHDLGIVSAEDVAELEEINIFECEMTRAGEYLLKEVRSSATLSSLIGVVCKDNFLAGVKNVICNIDMGNLLHQYALKNKEVSKIEVAHKERRIHVTYSCKNDLWYEFDLRNRGLAARSLYIPKKNMVISGLKEEIGVKNFGGIYIQSNTELCEYLIKVIGAFQSEDTEENKILLEVFLSYVFDNKVLEVAYKQDVNTSNMFKQLLEERFVRVSNELIEKMWAKIDTQEFVNKILTKNYTLYSIDNWSRKNDSI